MWDQHRAWHQPYSGHVGPTQGMTPTLLWPCGTNTGHDTNLALAMWDQHRANSKKEKKRRPNSLSKLFLEPLSTLKHLLVLTTGVIQFSLWSITYTTGVIPFTLCGHHLHNRCHSVHSVWASSTLLVSLNSLCVASPTPLVSFSLLCEASPTLPVSFSSLCMDSSTSPTLPVSFSSLCMDSPT